MKNKSRFIYILISSLIAFIIAMAGCASQTGNTPDYIPVIPDINTDGKHEFEIGSTEHFIVSNGVSTYKIVVPEEAGEIELLAARELAHFFNEGTDIKLEIVSDLNKSFNGQNTFLSVGKTKLFTEASLNVDYSVLGAEGVYIKTVGKTVFMCGAEGQGTLYSVYEFLSQTLNFEVFYADSIRLNRNVKNMPLMNFTIVDVPDFQTRVSGSGFVSADNMFKNRLRLKNYVDSFIFVNGREVHNSFHYLPKDIYNNPNDPANYHPNWYSPSGTQLDYTARGDAAEYQLMVNQVVSVMKEHLRNNPGNIITMTQEDSNTWSSHEASVASRETYGTDSAVVIKFLNDVNASVRDWMFIDEEGKPFARDLNILFFAYDKTTAAPVYYDEAAKAYKPIDQSVVCSSGVSVFYAPIDLDYTQSIYAPVNSMFLENFNKWAAISEKVFLWLYSTNFNFFLVPYDSFNFLSELYRYSKSIGAEYIYNQTQHNQYGGATAWHILKNYLSAKLMWNVNANVEDLTNQFFAEYFGLAAAPMRTFYEQQRIHTRMLADEKGFGGLRSVYFAAVNASFWPRQLLLDWKTLCLEAFAAIEPLRNSDPVLHETIEKHIIMEQISVDYLLIKLYLSSFSPAQQDSLKNTFKTNVVKTGLTRESQYSSMAELFASIF